MKHVKDKNGRIIKIGHYVMFTGECIKTNRYYNLVPSMKKLIGKKYVRVYNIRIGNGDTLPDKIDCEGYCWHPSDAEVRRPDNKVIKPKNKGPVTFDPKNLVL